MTKDQQVFWNSTKCWTSSWKNLDC